MLWRLSDLFDDILDLLDEAGLWMARSFFGIPQRSWIEDMTDSILELTLYEFQKAGHSNDPRCVEMMAELAKRGLTPLV